MSYADRYSSRRSPASLALAVGLHFAFVLALIGGLQMRSAPTPPITTIAQVLSDPPQYPEMSIPVVDPTVRPITVATPDPTEVAICP